MQVGREQDAGPGAPGTDRFPPSNRQRAGAPGTPIDERRELLNSRERELLVNEVIDELLGLEAVEVRGRPHEPEFLDDLIEALDALPVPVPLVLHDVHEIARPEPPEEVAHWPLTHVSPLVPQLVPSCFGLATHWPFSQTPSLHQSWFIW